MAINFILECKHCGNEFCDRAYRVGHPRYFCSDACRIAYHKPKPKGPQQATCEHCGDAFTAERSTARFCSARCRVYASRKRKPKKHK